MITFPVAALDQVNVGGVKCIVRQIVGTAKASRQTKMSHLFRTVGTLIIALMAGILVLAIPLQARIQLDIVAKFWDGDVELDVVTVLDSDVEPSKGKAALLGITKPSRSSFSFRLEEWLLLIELWSKAVKAQSASWKVIGSMTETETLRASDLTISAGPGAKFVIRSSQKGTATFVLSRGDMAGFERALHRVKEFLSQ